MELLHRAVVTRTIRCKPDAQVMKRPEAIELLDQPRQKEVTARAWSFRIGGKIGQQGFQEHQVGGTDPCVPSGRPREEQNAPSYSEESDLYHWPRAKREMVRKRECPWLLIQH